MNPFISSIPSATIVATNVGLSSESNLIENVSVGLALPFTQKLTNDYFVKINGKTVINFNSIAGFCLQGNSNCYFLVGNKFHTISEHYIHEVKKLYGLFLQNRLNNQFCATHARLSTTHFSTDEENEIPKKRGGYINSSNIKLELLNKKLDFDKIIYLQRRETLTTVYFEDGTIRHFYDTLYSFEKFLGSNSPFIRIRRNCIINLKHIDYYQSNPQTKIGEVMVASQIFSISRRLFPEFRKKIQFITSK